MLTKEAILAADDLPTEDLHVPEWGGPVRVRGLNCADRDAFLMELLRWKKGDTFDPAGVHGQKAKLVQMTVCNGDGSLLFNVEDRAALGVKSAAALDRIYAVAMRLSGLSAEAAETAEVVGKFESGGSSGSGSS